MSSEQVMRRDGSFIVRIWWERGDGVDTATAHWRGWIQHVRNGNQIYFANLHDLTNFIEREAGIHPVTDEAAQGLV
jgi:hypothetical protein